MPQPDEPPVRPDGLQLEDRRRYQEKLWTVERCAWVAFIAITLGALAGITGAGGILSRHSATMDGGEIDHPRIARWQASDEMTVRFVEGAGARSLLLSSGFVESFQIETVQPRPTRVEAVADGQVMHFASADGPVQVVLHLRPQHPGLARYRASINGGTAADLSTLILP